MLLISIVLRFQTSVTILYLSWKCQCFTLKLFVELRRIRHRMKCCMALWSIVPYSFVMIWIVLYCVVLCCIVLHCIVLYYIVSRCIVLYCVVLYCVVLYCVSRCVVLYCVVLCCVVLYCKVHRRIVLPYLVFFPFVSTPTLFYPSFSTSFSTSSLTLSLLFSLTLFSTSFLYLFCPQGIRSSARWVRIGICGAAKKTTRRGRERGSVVCVFFVVLLLLFYLFLSSWKQCCDLLCVETVGIFSTFCKTNLM